MKYLNYLLTVFLFLCLQNCKTSDLQQIPDPSLHNNESEPCLVSISSETLLDTLKIQFEYWDYLLMQHFEQEFICLNFSDTILQLDIRKPKLVRFTLNNTYLPLFSYPGLRCQLKIESINDRLNITLDKDPSISEYYTLAGRSTFGTPDGEWLEVERTVLNEKERKQQILDSLSNQLPEWFYEMEDKNLHLFYYNMLISAYGYRKQLLGYNELFPGQLVNFLDTINLVESENYIEPQYAQIVFSKLILPELRSQDTTASIPKRFKIALERLIRTPRENHFITADQQQNFILHYYCAMHRSSRKYPQDLFDKYYEALDPGRQRMATSVVEERISLNNEIASNFTLKKEDGTFIDLAEFRGKPVWVSFWFTGCKPCIREFPIENQLVEKYRDTDMQFISICTNSDEQMWKKMIREHHLKTQNLFANENWSNIISERYQITSYPKWMLIDRNGKIIQEKLVDPGNPEINSWFVKVL
ncbi:MAG: TlpA family protein disulfide reductase [Saprospiraceae bacterium]|nr:TlpA family protein disulfide reductase [Saprospiraceae bacterium]